MKSSRSTLLPSIIVLIVVLFIIGLFFIISSPQVNEKDHIDEYGPDVKHIEKQFHFSPPELVKGDEFTNVYINEADFNSIHDQWPILPVNVTTFEFTFGTKIVDIETTCSETKVISISQPVAYGSCSTATEESEEIYNADELFPTKVVSFHTGGGLSKGVHKTFLSLRVNPTRYNPSNNSIHFVDNVTVTIHYKEPDYSFLEEIDEYDLLIISPESFVSSLQRLVDYKEFHGIETRLYSVKEIENKVDGFDRQEKIKYFIKRELENFGIDSVLLVGGIEGQSTRWSLPVRYSHVLIREGTQELLEPKFISDLYYADIYDSEGNFSSWDTNDNNVFGEYDGGVVDEMDLYPDVLVGRLPCRNTREVNSIVDKIIAYETNTKNSDWFNNLILISGDHWDDENHISEGVLIMEEAARILDDFNSVELFATEENTLLSRDIRKAMNQGAGFAYFCGHGSSSVWGIHYPPDASGWAPSLTRLKLLPFYKTRNMNFLRNGDKLPVTLVGGCNNGQFDVSFFNSLQQGKIRLSSHCWAWHLTIQKRGGSIATIANTGLGTHAMDDNDNNGVNDYLEVLDGWLELKFFELYQYDDLDVVGQTQQEAMTQYLHSFLGAGDEMDVKMVQQWQLFGDPTLKIGGY